MSLICQGNTKINHNYININKIMQFVLFFPQIRPEKAAPAYELTEEETKIIDILKSNENIDLNELKSQAGLSGKKWDKSMKNLAKYNLTKVTIDGDSKTVSYLGE